jgi:hypothetical protein
VTEEDALIEGLTPLEAQAFHQNGTLRPEIAVRLAMQWMEAGEDHVDVAVLATAEEADWALIRQDFRKSMDAFAIKSLSERTAALVRLRRILDWLAAKPFRLKALGPVLVEHFPVSVRQTASPSALNLNFDLLQQASEDFYDLSFRINRTEEAMQALINSALRISEDMKHQIDGELAS